MLSRMTLSMIDFMIFEHPQQLNIAKRFSERQLIMQCLFSVGGCGLHNYVLTFVMCHA